MLAGVLFDMDGTLVDSEKVWGVGLRELAVRYGGTLSDEARRLLAVWPREPVVTSRPPERPETPLSVSCLLTGTRIDPSLISQLRKEFLSADRVDVLCSFIKWSGIRVLEDELRTVAARPGTTMRIITTPYMGATDLKAVEFLTGLPNTENAWR